MSCIGIDIDGTLYPWTTAANELAMDKFGIDDPGEHLHWDHLKGLLSSEQFAWLWTYEAAPLLFGRHDLIYPGAQEVVNELCAEHDVHFVTHRNPEKTGAITAEWISRNFVGYKGLHILDNSISKLGVLDFDFFIDDKAEIIEEFCETPLVLPIMPDRPWNLTVTHPVARRFFGWREVLDIVKENA
jgi:uncharacterized HAD superfamily protein